MPSEESSTSGSLFPPGRRRISRASITPSISGICMSRTPTSNSSPARSQSSASDAEWAARGTMPQLATTVVRMRRLVALSSTMSMRRSLRCSLGPARKGRGRVGTNSVRMVKLKVEPFAHLALHPHGSAHEFGQAPADGQSQAGAAKAARGGGVDLGEGMEQPVHRLLRYADAGVGDAEQQLDGLAGAILHQRRARIRFPLRNAPSGEKLARAATAARGWPGRLRAAGVNPVSRAGRG